MKKNAFTLVELLATILIVLLITVLLFYSIVKVDEDTRKKSCEAKKDLIITGAKLWGKDNVNDLSEECSYVFVRDLIAGEYLLGDADDKTVLKHPITKGSMNNIKACVTYEYENNKYRVKAIIEGDICEQ